MILLPDRVGTYSVFKTTTATGRRIQCFDKKSRRNRSPRLRDSIASAYSLTGLPGISRITLYKVFRKVQMHCREPIRRKLRRISSYAAQSTKQQDCHLSGLILCFRTHENQAGNRKRDIGCREPL